MISKCALLIDSTAVAGLAGVHGLGDKCILQLFKGSLLLHLRVLQPCYKLLLLLLHLGDIGLVLQPLILLASQLILHLLACFLPFVLLAPELLILGLHLLMLDHVLDHVCLGHVLVILVVKELFGLMLLLLCITDFLLYPFFVSHFVIHDLLSLFLLLGHMDHSFLGFFVYSLLHAHLLFLLRVHVSLSLLNDFSGLFPGLVYFLVGSNFFLLQKTDPVAQQFQVFICALPGNFGSY